MSKIELDDNVTNINNAVLPYNENFRKIEEEFQDKVLYRDNPEGEPNEMEVALDMNANRIYNLPEPVNGHEAARLKDVQNAIAGADHANLIKFTPYKDIESDSVQGAIQEVRDDAELARNQLELDLNNFEEQFDILWNTYFNVHASQSEYGTIKLATQQEAIDGTNNDKAITPLTLKQAIGNLLSTEIQYLGIPIGSVIALRDDLPGVVPPPIDSPNFRFIKLTASDSYNSGVLIGQSISGSFPLLTATATIGLSTSPLFGAGIYLINTERRFLRAGNSGLVEDDALQYHNHVTPSLFVNDTPIIAANTALASQRAPTSSTPTSSFTAGSRTASETRPRNMGITYYMRIK